MIHIDFTAINVHVVRFEYWYLYFNLQDNITAVAWKGGHSSIEGRLLDVYIYEPI